MGRGEFVRVFLEKKNKDHETLFQRILWLNDPQSAWLLLLMCQWEDGLCSAHRNRESAHWASWADCLRMVHDRHPDVAETMIAQLEVGTVTCFEGVQRCRRLVEDARTPEPCQPQYGATEGDEDGGTEFRSHSSLAFPQRSNEGPPQIPTWPPSLLHHSRLSLRPGSPGSTRNRSTSCSAAASICPFPSLCAPADVAANSTCLATIAQRVQRQGYWEEGGSLWSVRPRRSVGKQEHEWPRMCGSETWTSKSSTF